MIYHACASTPVYQSETKFAYCLHNFQTYVWSKIKKGSRDHDHTLLRVSCPPYAGAWYSLLVYKVWSLASAVPEIWLVPTKIDYCSRILIDHTLYRDFCHYWAKTCSYQPDYRIWSLYLRPLRIYEKGFKMWKMGWFGAVRGHPRSLNSDIRQSTYEFLLAFHSICVPILHRFAKFKEVTWLSTHPFWE